MSNLLKVMKCRTYILFKNLFFIIIKLSRTEVDEIFEQLCSKHKSLLGSVKEIDLSQQTLLVKGTPFQPPLEQIIQFAEDTLTFGGQVSAQIETSLSVLAFKGLNTQSLVDNFKISSDWQKKIPEIIAYTSFCSENEI